MYGLNDELINKIKKISKNYTKALNRLKEALLEEPTDIVVDGTLQRYEFTFELA